jgi:hypothetical protein
MTGQQHAKTRPGVRVEHARQEIESVDEDDVYKP